MHPHFLTRNFISEGSAQSCIFKYFSSHNVFQTSTLLTMYVQLYMYLNKFLKTFKAKLHFSIYILSQFVEGCHGELDRLPGIVCHEKQDQRMCHDERWNVF